jgi:hypothetical protein
MSAYDEETRGLLNNTEKKRTKSHRLLILVAAALVVSSVGVVISLLYRESPISGTIATYPLYITRQ